MYDQQHRQKRWPHNTNAICASGRAARVGVLPPVVLRPPVRWRRRVGGSGGTSMFALAGDFDWRRLDVSTEADAVRPSCAATAAAAAAGFVLCCCGPRTQQNSWKFRRHFSADGATCSRRCATRHCLQNVFCFFAAASSMQMMIYIRPDVLYSDDDDILTPKQSLLINTSLPVITRVFCLFHYKRVCDN